MGIRYLGLAFLAAACCAAALVFLFFGATGAAVTKTVSPSVQLGSSFTLSMNDATNVQWGSQSAGASLSGTIEAQVTANVSWALTVQPTGGDSSTHELSDDTHRIAASCFTYTSCADSANPPPAGNGRSTSTQFDGDNQTDVWTGGTPTVGCAVDITYVLNVPGSQPPGAYTTTHTYTLAPA